MLDNWAYIDGIALRNHTDLLEVLYDPSLSFDRILNILESYIIDVQTMRVGLATEENESFYDKIQKIKRDGTIEEDSPVQTRAKPNNLRYIEPTEDGYPGLGPPAGVIG